MPPNPPTADETRIRILTEAERLFRHYGYSKTTVADIADACRMSPANVYRFFASRSQITEAICKHIISDLEMRLRKIAAEDAPASERLTDFIRLIASHTLEVLIDQKKVHEMVVVAMEENWDAIKLHIEATAAIIAAIIVSGIESGEFRHQDVSTAARCVCASIAALKHPVLVAQCRDDPTQPSPDEMAAFLISALKA